MFSTAGSLLQARATYGAVMRQAVAQHEFDRRLRREDEAVDRVLEACALASSLPSQPESNLGPALEGIDLAMRTLKAVKRGEPIPPV
ncbi:hypothetical protein AB0C10_18895 [Microbispora amethystogenes]|uniref:hypothetical protein n=1 Tax=Microbispora amethystogenes TaxID=1427754 RepID=UPI003408D686